MRSISVFDRAVNTTLAPASANSATLASPIPRLAPVIKTVFPDKSIASSLVNMGVPTMAHGGKTMQPLEQRDELSQIQRIYEGRVFDVSTFNFIHRVFGWSIW